MDFIEDKEIKTNNDGVNYLNVSVFLALLAFFILLNVISIENIKKTDKLKQSVTGEFSEKRLYQEFMVFSKRDYEASIGNYSYDFISIISDFLSRNQDIVRTQIFQNNVYYYFNINIFRFFGTDNNLRRAGADEFIRNLNSVISLNRKNQDSKAKLILFADKNDVDDINSKLAKLRDLKKSIENIEPKHIEFSLSIISDSQSELLKQIQIIFSKNEF
jgi:hypothetical protein